MEEGLEKIYSFNVFNVEHRLNFLPSLSFLLSFVPSFRDVYPFQISIYFFMNLREIILPNRFLRHLLSKSAADNRLETKIEENCAIQRSKPSGVYIMIFFGPEGVLRKKTESGRHTRCPQPSLWPPRALSRLLFIFLFFHKFQNGENFLLENFWSPITYRNTYLFVFRV